MRPARRHACTTSANSARFDSTTATDSPAPSPRDLRALTDRQMFAFNSENVRSPFGERTAMTSGITRAHRASDVAVAAASARSSAVGNDEEFRSAE